MRKEDYLCFSDNVLLEQTVEELFAGASDNGIKGKQNCSHMLIFATSIWLTEQNSQGVLNQCDVHV